MIAQSMINSIFFLTIKITGNMEL